MKVGKDLMAASAAPLVLAILAEGESYGYAIVRRVRELSDGELEWTDGLLYPLLHRLEDAGHVSSRWGVSDTGRRRRYYEITDRGRSELAEHRRQWAAVAAALQAAWHGLGDAVDGTMRPGLAL
ncbi:PadR family transcriptional regulator [Demequina iriomotensis]|uniref:PadR family transcriptional regulator n=1 Tax=Demequina iriomotensis TaxID=1536641 RepID=UPI0007849CB7|nr:helix-turn-helix transcriptional regulator [Demequina iriomotensis]